MKHFAMAAIAVLGMETAWGQTASVRGGQVVVDSQSHWEQWQFPQGTVEIEGGVISPHFVPKNSDAASDIVDHLMRNPPGGKDPADVTLADALQAGTNPAAVANLFDDDENHVTGSRQATAPSGSGGSRSTSGGWFRQSGSC